MSLLMLQHAKPIVAVAFAVLMTAVPSASGQAPRPSPDPGLLAEITRADQGMFDAFNARDVERLMTFFAEETIGRISGLPGQHKAL